MRIFCKGSHFFVSSFKNDEKILVTKKKVIIFALSKIT